MNRPWSWTILLFGALFAASHLATAATLNESLVGYWSFDTNGTDTSRNNNHLVNSTGAKIISSSCKLNGCTNLSGATTAKWNKSGSNTTGWWTADGDNSECFWANTRNLTRLQDWFELGASSSLSDVITRTNATEITDNVYGSMQHVVGGLSGINNTWGFLCRSYNTTTNNVTYYLNGMVFGTATQGGLTFSPGDIVIGQYDGAPSASVDGMIDEFSVFNKTLTAQEVATLYNGGSGCTPPFTNCTSYVTIQIKNQVNDSYLPSFCVIVANSTSTQHKCTNTSSTQINATGVKNITIWDIGSGDNASGGASYLEQTATNYNLTGAASLTVSTSQSILNLTAHRAVTNESISTFNVTNWRAFNTTNASVMLVPANNGTNNIKVDVAGNTSLNFSVLVSSPLSIVDFAATGFYDNVLNSSGNGSPVLSALNCTSCNPPYGSTTSPYVTSDTTPTFRFTTNGNANCRVGASDVNYTTMGSSRQCMGGEGLTLHICTLTTQDALPLESGVMYVSCRNSADGNESAASSSGALQITGIATSPSAAIDYGIHNSVVWPGATVYSEQQVYLRDVHNNQVLATVDRVVAYGNQRWLFHYDNTTTLGLFNITPVVYALEMGNLTFLQVESAVASYINTTKN